MIAPRLLLLHLAALLAASSGVAVVAFVGLDIADGVCRIVRTWDRAADAVVRVGLAAVQPVTWRTR